MLEIVFAAVAVVLGLSSYAFLTGQRAPAEGFSPQLVTLLLLANLLPLLALLLLIARRVAILIANRRAGRAGAQLHVRLVALFAALAAATPGTAWFTSSFDHYQEARKEDLGDLAAS